MNEEIKDKNQIRKCPLCGREYLKPQRYCQKCDILLMRLSEYERLGMEANRANFQKEVKTQEQTSTQSNTPKCPTCGSTNIEKISTTSKAAGFVAVGVFSKNFSKTFHCRNCGYRW